MNQPIAAFRRAIEAAGLSVPPEIIPDGRLHRFHVEGDRRADRNGWYLFHADDPPAGAFGDWKRDIRQTWSSRPERDLSEEDLAAWRERMAAAKQARKAEEKKDRERAAARARTIWHRSTPADPQHEYLQRKGVRPHGIKQKGDLLVVPVSSEKTIEGLQFISPDGTKRFLRGTTKRGRYHPIGQPNGKVTICEGYATAATIHETTGMAAVVAFDAGNLKTVAQRIRERFPDLSIIVAGDNDRRTAGNPGKKAAQEAAAAVGGTLALPTFAEDEEGSDWNDVMASHGPSAVISGLVNGAGGDPHEEPAEEPAPPSRNGKRGGNGGKRGGGKGIQTGGGGVRLEDFYAYMPMHQYIFAPSRELWPSSSVNARVSSPLKDGKASGWLDEYRAVEQMTWAPGEPMVVRDRLISHGGWINRPGCSCFNLYRPPTIQPGDPKGAAPWISHVRLIYPETADHIIKWLAHRVQKPAEKVNHALVLGGLQGIGKDTLLEPVKHAVGPWNFSEVSPPALLGRFNSFVKSVILRVSEARDLGDVDRYGFYEHMKMYTAAPPDVLRCDEKNIREYSVPNVCGVILTTNHKSAGIYLPADDRRHFVAWSELTKDDIPDGYFPELYGWYERGGHEHVAAYLAQLDISGWDPKSPPPKTAAFWDVVDANRAPEDADLADALDRLADPDAVTLRELADVADSAFGEWLKDRRNSRQIPHRMESAGYIPVRNDGTKDGRWKVEGKNQVIYARRELSVRDRIAAAQKLATGYR